MRGLLSMLVLAAGLAGAGDALADTRGNYLEGATKAGVFVKLSFDAEDCGIKEDDVRDAYMRSFNSSALKLVESNIDIAIDINIHSAIMKSKGGKVIGCASIVALEAWVYSGYRKLKFSRNSILTKSILYDDKRKIVSALKDHPAHIRRLIDVLAGKFVAAHRKFNP